MQATRRRRKEEEIKKTGTRYNSPRTLGKAVAKVKRNLPSSSSLEPSKLPAESCTGTSVVSAVSSKDICAGSYVLVQLLCKSGKKVSQYRYVGVCQSNIDEDGEVRVQFLKTIDGKLFVEVLNNVADVRYEDIAKLEAPEKKINGNSTSIEFSMNIDIFEKK